MLFFQQRLFDVEFILWIDFYHLIQFNFLCSPSKKFLFLAILIAHFMLFNDFLGEKKKELEEVLPWPLNIKFLSATPARRWWRWTLGEEELIGLR